MRILLLNQFTPPARPPTARLVGDLAAALEDAGHEVVCIGAASEYGMARGTRRLLRDLGAHAAISWKVLRAGRCDWIIAFSDPTGLPFTARILAGLKRAALAHWAMDVYPQTAVALGAVKDGFTVRLITAAMRFGYRGCRLVAALDDDMKAEVQRASGREVQVLPPWPPAVIPEQVPLRNGGRRRWLYAGNLGRAHDFETMLRAQRILEDRGANWELCIQGGGAARPAAQGLATELSLRHCLWTDYVAEDALLPALTGANVLIATQKPETQGLLWPSKLALMKHLDLPIAWIGPVQGAVADELRRLPRAGLFAPGQAAELAAWLESMADNSSRCEPLRIRQSVEAEREAGFQWWLSRLSAKR